MNEETSKMGNRFEQDTHVVKAGDERYDVDLDETWWVERGPNGGYVGAILARAMAHVVPEGEPLRSMTVRYLRGCDAGNARVEVQRSHQGSTVSTARARLEQGGSLTAIAQATYGAHRSGPSLTRLRAPDVLGFDEGLALPQEGPIEPPRFTQHVSYRIAGGELPLAGAGDPRMTVWMRLAEPAPYDGPVVVFLADAWMPAMMAALHEPMAVPTVDLTVHLTGRLPADPSEPVLGVFTADHASDGYVIEDADLYDAQGALLARARQLRRIFAYEG